MELKYVVLTILKILISVPAIILYQTSEINGAALMGGHLDNKNSTESVVRDYDIYDNQEIVDNIDNKTFMAKSQEMLNENSKENNANSEEIPDPSPLVVPGYNLPENIFNKGKPFYLEKDPLTGQIDFNTKTSSLKLDDDLYDYIEEEPSSDIYDKSNIDRKDGSLSSHKPSDVNQLTPNFHDFLNLPVKYNSDKYVYPLISSSYANTKIQGNVNKYYNHKNYNIKTSTFKPTQSPTYYSSTYYPNTRTTEYFTTTPTPSTTTKTTTQIYLTSSKQPEVNLMNSGMNHPSFQEDFEDYYEPNTKKVSSEIYLTTNTPSNVNNIYLTTKSYIITTKKPMSLFEQLFGDYDETVATTEKTKPPPLFGNLPPNKNKNKYEGETKTEKPSYTTPIYSHYPNSHAGPYPTNVLTGSNMGVNSNSYEYEDEEVADYDNEDKYTINKPAKEVVSQNESTSIISNKSNNTVLNVNTINETKLEKNSNQHQNLENQTEPTTTTTPKVTSLPLGENHIASLNNRQPIIVATQNLREQLNSEKVLPKPFSVDKNAPSTSNIHIAPDQDTVSFVVGHHQNVDGGQYVGVGTTLKESPYDNNPFRPLYEQQSQYDNKDVVSYTIQSSPEIVKFPTQNFPEVAGSAVTIQPEKNSEAALAIGVPVNGIKQVPGQVADDDIELNTESIEFPKGAGQKIVFPDDKEELPQLPQVPQSTSFIPPPPPPSNNREVLKLSSQPMYHQLPSDLTPPKEEQVTTTIRKDRPRPPWDPRPGHFHSGKPEYVRPPRPPPELAFKRIDNLPNVLPQFRPNMKNNAPVHYFDNRLNRQPLLERPSNRPIGFFEKLLPPPPPKNLHNLRKIPPHPPQNLDQIRPSQIADDRIINEAPQKLVNHHDQFGFYQTPPKVVLPNRRITNIEGDVETLQMIQAKQSDKKEIVLPEQEAIITSEKVMNSKNATEKPLYVVYPVNTPPIKLDVIDTNKKESVVIGTRAELPLPPSKINQNFNNYEQNPILHPKDRNDAPILKPHNPKPSFPIKSDFPYALERPDSSEIPSANSNNLDDLKYDDENFVSTNQWNTIGEKIGGNSKTSQISATLKTFTEKPIAVAYTPTEPHDKYDFDKYSMPNYASPVIPEIRPGTVDDDKTYNKRNEFTVSAVMHTHPQMDLTLQNKRPQYSINHRIDEDTSANIPDQLDFQAPFQASVSVDSKSEGWAVVRNKNKSTTENSLEATTASLATTSEFDIENFKPQLIGGFKPIYDFPQADYTSRETDASLGERQER